MLINLSESKNLVVKSFLIALMCSKMLIDSDIRKCRLGSVNEWTVILDIYSCHKNFTAHDAAIDMNFKSPKRPFITLLCQVWAERLRVITCF